MKPLELLAAVDVKAGMAVRLNKADLGSQEEFGAPKDVIKDFISAGTKWIHLVDLDAAFGVGDNSALLKNLIKDSKVKVQISGGIIDEESLNVALATTAARINLATSCLTDIEWVKKILLAYGERISISLDIKDDLLTARGSGVVVGDLFKYLKILNNAGCNRYVVTDTATDGALSGPNFDLLKKISQATDSAVIASGGVAKLSDLQELRQMGVEGVILGKALYVGAIDIASAIEVCYK
jgi:1-(5-phosphoribosyl)-5-[(5-phosphoribosylamino)methylideneamino] imidazole-4-carboxamide isomerase/N-(5'phosphoribosyl)anthranilate isomerase